MSAMFSVLERYAWWQRATPRERVALCVGTSLIIIAFFGSFVVVPMRDSLANAPQDRAQRKALLVQARERLSTIQSLRADAAPHVNARNSIERALDRQGIARSDATIDATNDRIALTLPAVRIADAAAIIDAVAHDGLRVAGATLAARADSADLRAELTFVRLNP